MSKEELQAVLEPLGCWDKFLRNLDIVEDSVPLDTLLRHSYASEILECAFLWAWSPEGHDYWAGIYIKLVAEGL